MKNKKYDIKQVGGEITKIAPEMEGIIKTVKDTNDFINYVRAKLQECVLNDDLIRALAIIDYTIHNTDLYGEDLILIKDTEDKKSISTIAYESGHSNFASSLTGFCQALHFVDEV